MTDFPVLPRRCLPVLADTLARAQARAVRTAVVAGMPFFLSSTPLDDLFVPHLKLQATALYRGVTTGHFLYQCSHIDNITWAVSTTAEADSLARCIGFLWIDLDRARVRTALSSAQPSSGGVHFEGGSCSPSLQVSEVASVSCPRGTAPIGSAAECLAAAAVLQLAFKAADPSGNSSHFPSGCYVRDERCVQDQKTCGVWFNPAESGQAELLSASICASAASLWAAPAHSASSSLLDECTELHANEASWVSIGIEQSLDGEASLAIDTLDFSPGATALQVSCTLLWRLGPLTGAQARSLRVRLPEVVDEIDAPIFAFAKGTGLCWRARVPRASIIDRPSSLVRVSFMCKQGAVSSWFGSQLRAHPEA